MAFLNKIILFGVLYFGSSLTYGKLAPIEISNQDTKAFAIERIQFTDVLRERAATQALKTISEAAKTIADAGGDKTATSDCEKGFKIAFRLLAACRENLNDALITAHRLANNDPEIAVATINKAVKQIMDLIFVASVPVQTVHGSALARVGELARPGLRAAIELLQHCGVLLFESLQNAERFASIGIKAGGAASDLAIAAAHEIFNTGEEAIYKLLKDSARSAFEGLKAAAGRAPIRGFTENREIEITNETPEAQIAIDELTLGFEETLHTVTEDHAIEALKTIYHHFLSSAYDNANAIVIAYRAIDGAEKLLGGNPETAVSALQKGLIAVENAILAVSADAILGLGAAGQICGAEVEKGLELAVIIVVEGRVNLYTDLTFAEKLAVIGLRTGNGNAARQGLKAARASITAASNALFTHFIDASRKAFNVLKVK